MNKLKTYKQKFVVLCLIVPLCPYVLAFIGLIKSFKAGSLGFCFSFFLAFSIQGIRCFRQFFLLG